MTMRTRSSDKCLALYGAAIGEPHDWQTAWSGRHSRPSVSSYATGRQDMPRSRISQEQRRYLGGTAVSGQAVLLFGFPAIVGVVAGYVSGGRLGGLVTTRLRALWLVWLAGGAQLAEYAVGPLDGWQGQTLRSVLLVATFVTVLGWLLVNLRGRSRLLKAAASTALGGGLLNGMAIALNGRMPYSPTAAAVAGIPPGQETAKNIAATQGSRLTLLGDFIPVAPVHAVISIGDILITLGAATVIATAMHQPTPQHITEAGVDSNHQCGALDDVAVHPGNVRPTALHHRSP